MDQKKHCSSCAYSYRQMEQSVRHFGGVKTQHCASADYNSDDYTHEMMMEDWNKGYCRFWTPKEERINQHEKQLFHRPTQ